MIVSAPVFHFWDWKYQQITKINNQQFNPLTEKKYEVSFIF